jgi:four helix bundle protein
MSKLLIDNYDLEERTAVFAEKVITLCGKIPKTIISAPIIEQLIKSGTSIGANYCEANGASNRKDFRNKIFICKKETMEIKYWLRLLAKVCSETTNDCRNIWKEAQELTLIFSKIAKSSK